MIEPLRLSFEVNCPVDHAFAVFEVPVEHHRVAVFQVERHAGDDSSCIVTDDRPSAGR